MVTSLILKFKDTQKTRKCFYLEDETFFLNKKVAGM